MITAEFPVALLKSGDVRCNIVLNAILSYDPDIDPVAVMLIVEAEDDDVVWTFSRDVLRIGINSYLPVGQGDIKFQYVGQRDGVENGLMVCLRNNTGHADIRLPHAEVLAFLDETIALVKPGEECFDRHIDELIEEILG